MRSEGDAVLEAIDEVLTLARETGVRAQISHLKTSGRANWGRIDAVLDKMDAAVDAGVLLGSDRYPFCASATDLDVVLPDWAQAGAAPAECARLADAATRARLAAELDASTRDWSSVMIGGTWHPETKACSGRRVDDLAAAYGTTPGEIICRILEKDRCRTGAFFFVMCEENLDRILSRPWVLPGSDASLRAPWGPLGADHPHPRAYATMPRFYRRLRALGFSREETIARMTSAVARRFGIGRRGVIETGASADLVVWDEASFGAEATYAAPHRFATGVSCVMVNGVVSYADGRFTGRRGGRFLERP
jgi:N-acyl-D-amino-acid deacylase